MTWHFKSIIGLPHSKRSFHQSENLRLHVLFDSIKAGKARSADVLIVDTAGRLHNKANLMSELDKMKRIAGREIEGAPHETLLVIDAVTGQNGLEQARQFLKTANVTGIVLTKLEDIAMGENITDFVQ